MDYFGIYIRIQNNVFEEHVNYDSLSLNFPKAVLSQQIYAMQLKNKRPT